MAELDPLALPASVAIMWADANSLYVRFPGPDGIPAIVRYPKSYASIAEVFAILCENPMENRQIVPRHPSTKVAKPISDELRAAALASIKKAGIL